MDEVITRIIEIERQCSADVEQAELSTQRGLKNTNTFLRKKRLRNTPGLYPQKVPD